MSVDTSRFMMRLTSPFSFRAVHRYWPLSSTWKRSKLVSILAYRPSCSGFNSRHSLYFKRKLLSCLGYSTQLLLDERVLQWLLLKPIKNWLVASSATQKKTHWERQFCGLNSCFQTQMSLVWLTAFQICFRGNFDGVEVTRQRWWKWTTEAKWCWSGPSYTGWWQAVLQIRKLII